MLIVRSDAMCVTDWRGWRRWCRRWRSNTTRRSRPGWCVQRTTGHARRRRVCDASRPSPRPRSAAAAAAAAAEAASWPVHSQDPSDARTAVPRTANNREEGLDTAADPREEDTQHWANCRIRTDVSGLWSPFQDCRHHAVMWTVRMACWVVRSPAVTNPCRRQQSLKLLLHVSLLTNTHLVSRYISSFSYRVE